MSKDFKVYEYTNTIVDSSEDSKIVDIYESFGWEKTNKEKVGNLFNKKVNINFKRNRNINHKNEVNRLQKNATDLLEKNQKLHSRKELIANVVCYSLGIIATLLFGLGFWLSMTNFGTDVNNEVGGICMGVIGFALGVGIYFIYKAIIKSQNKKILPTIQMNEDKIAIMCEQSLDLLNNTTFN